MDKMTGLAQYLTRLGEELKVLESDVSKIIVSEKERQKGGKEIKLSKNTIMPMTILRKDKDAVDKAKENPNVTFITDSINKIFKGR